MSIFADDEIVREYEDEGEFVFREPNFEHLLKLRKCFQGDGLLEEAQRQASGDEDEVDVAFSIDDIDFDESKELIVSLLKEWPSDRDITVDNISELKTEVTLWLFNQVSGIVSEQSELEEDEEKN
jgi:hypothetical protein